MTIDRAGIILINKEGYILLIKGKSSKKWGFPKGYIEKGETIEECAIREFNEETGLKFESNQILYDGIFTATNCQYLIMYLQISNFKKVSKIDSNEILDVKWFKQKHIKNLDKNKGLLIYYEKFIKPKYIKNKKIVKSIDEDGWTTVNIGFCNKYINIESDIINTGNFFSYFS